MPKGNGIGTLFLHILAVFPFIFGFWSVLNEVQWLNATMLCGLFRYDLKL